jgi:thiol-disulfide isomerase/thioredoxin
MLKHIIFTISILSSFNIAYAKELESSFKYKQLQSFDVIDDVPLYDLEGKKHYLEEYEGKTILLVFWATWCSPCVNEMVDLDLLQKDFRKLSFVILPVSEDYAGIEVVKKFYDGYDIRHLLLLHDYKNSLFKAQGIAGLPTSILINGDGKAVGMFTGSVNWYDENVRNILLSHISGNPAVPKNSYKDQSLNQRMNMGQPKEKESQKIEEKPAQDTTSPAADEQTKENLDEHKEAK